MFDIKKIGTGIVDKLLQKIASNDTASKKVIGQIVGDIRNNFNKLDCDNCCIFVGTKAYKDYAEKKGVGFFEIDKNSLLQISGIPSGLITFERFSEFFKDENNDGIFCVTLYVDSENDLVMTIYSYNDKVEPIETVEIISKKLIDFISDAITSIGNKESGVKDDVMGAIDKITEMQLPESE